MKPFTWLVGGPHLQLITDLSPEEFARAFTESVDKPFRLSTSIATGSTPMIGRLLSQGRFWLREQTLYRNSGRPYFNGRVQPSGAGSEITGSFNVHPLAVAIMAMFLFLAIQFSAIFCFAAASSLIAGEPDAIWGLLAAVAALAGFAAAAVFTNVISKKKQEKYLEFFRQTFGAQLLERKE